MMNIIRRLRSPLAVVGFIVGFLKPIVRLVNDMSNWNFLVNNAQDIGKFLNTGWGTLATVIGGCLLIAIAIWRPADSAKRKPTAAVRPSPAERQDVRRARRFLEIAEHDDANMQRMVQHLSIAAIRPNLQAHAPYVDIDLVFSNASVYEVTFSRVHGLLLYKNEPFQNPLDLSVVRSTSPSYAAPMPSLARGVGGLTLRQWIPPETARRMLQEVQPIVLDTRPAAVVFAYRNQNNEQKEVAVGILSQVNFSAIIAASPGGVNQVTFEKPWPSSQEG